MMKKIQDNTLIMTELAPEGIILIDKPLKISSFGVVAALRRLTKVKKIGHCGTLDPLASGLLVCLIGKKYTRQSDSFLGCEKTYIAKVHLGHSTTTYDLEGEITNQSEIQPSFDQVQAAVNTFQGTTLQTPPLFSAKKVGGVKACDAARAGKTVELKACEVTMNLDILAYNYPLLEIKISCSKGTYIRSLAHDLGLKLQTYAHLCGLRRIQSGSFSIDQAICLDNLKTHPELLSQYLKT
jgi:tRNA pseudouridine55 synthase